MLFIHEEIFIFPQVQTRFPPFGGSGGGSVLALLESYARPRPWDGNIDMCGCLFWSWVHSLQWESGVTILQIDKNNPSWDTSYWQKGSLFSAICPAHHNCVAGEHELVSAKESIEPSEFKVFQSDFVYRTQFDDSRFLPIKSTQPYRFPLLCGFNIARRIKFSPKRTWMEARVASTTAERRSKAGPN